MKTVIYFILSLTFFAGCSSRNIIYKENAVTQSRASKLYENRLRLAHINIYQIDFKEQNVNAVQYIKSDWNYKNIIFSELIKKQGGRPRWH